MDTTPLPRRYRWTWNCRHLCISTWKQAQDLPSYGESDSRTKPSLAAMELCILRSLRRRHGSGVPCPPLLRIRLTTCHRAQGRPFPKANKINLSSGSQSPKTRRMEWRKCKSSTCRPNVSFRQDSHSWGAITPVISSGARLATGQPASSPSQVETTAAPSQAK